MTGWKKTNQFAPALHHTNLLIFYASDGSPERFAVAYLTDEDRALFGCLSDVLWLSRQSLDEHKASHPEVSADNYRAIPDIVRDGQVWAGHSLRRYLLLWIGGEPYRAAIKTDKQGEEAWFLSLVISGNKFRFSDSPPRFTLLPGAAKYVFPGRRAVRGYLRSTLVLGHFWR